MTLGWLMVAVALVAVALKVSALDQRRADLVSRAFIYEVKALAHRSMAERVGTDGGPRSESGDQHRHLAQQYERLREEYVRAAQDPWYPVPQDPPAPVWPK